MRIEDLKVGTKVRFNHEVERYPHFIIPEGATGLVTENWFEGEPPKPVLILIKLDKPINGMEEWTNKFQFHTDDADVDLEVLNEQAV